MTIVPSSNFAKTLTDKFVCAIIFPRNCYLWRESLKARKQNFVMVPPAHPDVGLKRDPCTICMVMFDLVHVGNKRGLFIPRHPAPISKWANPLHEEPCLGSGRFVRDG